MRYNWWVEKMRRVVRKVLMKSALRNSRPFRMSSKPDLWFLTSRKNRVRIFRRCDIFSAGVYHVCRTGNSINGTMAWASCGEVYHAFYFYGMSLRQIEWFIQWLAVVNLVSVLSFTNWSGIKSPTLNGWKARLALAGNPNHEPGVQGARGSWRSIQLRYNAYMRRARFSVSSLSDPCEKDKALNCPSSGHHKPLYRPYTYWNSWYP